MIKSKFYKPPTFKERLVSLKYSILFWKGRKKGMIHTRNIQLDDLRYIFFPKGFERYGYLGTQIWDKKSDYFKALYPLVLALDYEAKPKWCPRWFLRFLHVFGADRSIVRVRNWRLNNLLTKLTKGIAFVDWKTKWTNYDLRISIHAPKHLQNLADAIEHNFYLEGKHKDLIKQIKELEPEFNKTNYPVKDLENYLDNLIEK